MSERAIRELIIILGVGLLVYAIATIFQAFTAISAFARNAQDYQVDELLTLLLVVGACYIVFSTLRWRELSAEVGEAQLSRGDVMEVEQARREAERSRHEAEQLETVNRELSETEANVLLRVNAAGMIVEANDGMELATGVSKDLLLGTLAFSYFTSPRRAEEALRRATEYGSAAENSDMELRHRNGDLTPVSYRAFAYETAGNMQVGVIVCRPRKA